MKKLLIFGVGLIGGSLALALKRSQPGWHVVGIGRHGDSLQEAISLGIIDESATDLSAALHNTDIVVIATPVAQTPAIFSAIAPFLDSHTVITDVGSTKADISSDALRLLDKHACRFVPGHPIAGAEKSGPAAANADLFVNKNVVLTPTEITDTHAVNTVRELWQTTGARVRQMSASEHDGIFAAVSHLPHLLAFALVDDLASRTNSSQFFEFAASGFRDFTRIAGSSPEMWRDISLANREALLQELDTYQQALSQLRESLHNEDGNQLLALFDRASRARIEWAQQHPQQASSWKI
ncbi:prephenate dehydrogenase/arogenate dehydrogenase family protein [Methylobacillus gramineus]|uniref:prephenate dehydrogenase n=1 Tax=Methylobacillus gramineus TaxID=755169 RepID=UPI001D000B93|nr:prephenate dehydrogenase/arogenate dehydrogenase family protein [Methylobacillus gramineus]MCB5183898.1 prephenate dehydrogenase/arogenate dehydrogenase family protein [Methylobacillus gramineus]